MIAVRDLVKRYGHVTALDGVTFDVQRGEVLGFLGPNGAGKSTTMRVLAGVLAPTSGTVTVDGLDAVEQSIEVRHRIGVLPENNPLYLDMRVAGALRFVGAARNMSSAEVERRLPIVLKETATSHVAGRFIGELSKGYRQRVGLAQALLAEPEILLLDEPTVGLDPAQIIEIRELIQRIGERKTIILCSHILPEVQATCGRILIINRGKIVASGTPEELASRARGKTSLTVVVEGPKDAVAAALAAVEGVTEVKAGAHEGNAHTFRLSTGAGVDARAAVAKAVSHHGWVLLELSAQGASLEDVFLQLTTSEG